MQTFFQQVLNGVIVGAIYGLVAFGITVTYGLTRLINFAHGEAVTAGGLVAWWLSGRGVAFPLAVAGAVVAGAAIGALLDRGVFRFTRTRPINGLIVSLGLIAASQALIVWLTHDEPKSIPSPLSGSAEIAGIRLSWQRVTTLAVVAVVFAALLVYLKRSRAGRATRAYAENAEAAAVMGVDGDRVVLRMFVLGTAVAALSGALALGLYPVSPTLGASMVIKAFVIALIGGLGSVGGALAAALAVGLAESLGAAYISSTWTQAFGYALMLLFLMVRPTGLGRGGAGAAI